MEITEENKEKEGMVPEQEISGSDADKAYDSDGNFEKDSQSDDQDAAAA